MADLFDPNQDQSMDNNTPNQGLLSRLLKRKAAQSVNVSKIRNRITRITKNAHQIRQKLTEATGDKRRKNLKAFGSNQVQKQTQAIKKVIKTPANKQANSWDHLDLTLSNGSNVVNPDVSMVRSGQQLSGLPTGGQVITPFEPPEPSTRSQPSFIERREARLKKEQEQHKPTFKKPDKVSKLFSHIEEILPSGTEKKEDKIEKLADNKFPENPVYEKPIRKEEKVKEPQSEKDKYPETNQEKQVNQIENKPVVQRQVETSKTDRTKSERNDTIVDREGFDVDKVIKPTSQKLSQENEQIKTVGSKKEEVKKDQLPLDAHEPIQKTKEIIGKALSDTKEIQEAPGRKIVDQELTQDRKVKQEQKNTEKPNKIQKLDQPVVKKLTDQPIKEPKTPEMKKSDDLSSDEPRIQKEEKLSEEKLSDFQSKIPIIKQKRDLISKNKRTNDFISRKFKQGTLTKKSPILRKASGTQNLVLRLPSKPETKLNPEKFLQTKIEKPVINLEDHLPSELDKPIQAASKSLPSAKEVKSPTNIQAGDEFKPSIKDQTFENSANNIKDFPTQKHDLTLNQTPLSAKITRKFSPRQVVTKKLDITSKPNQNLPIIMRSFEKQDSESSEEKVKTKPDLKNVDRINRNTISQQPDRTISLSEKQRILLDKVLVTRVGAKKIQDGVLKKNEEIHSIRRNAPPEKQPDHGVDRISSAMVSSKFSNTVDKRSKKPVINPIVKPTNEGVKPQSKLGIENTLLQKKTSSFSKEDLPVLKTKKIEEPEPVEAIEYSVPGPIVQREIDDTAEPNSSNPQEVIVERPDLERLAKDVYPIIKRWIAIEKERTSGRLY